MKDRHDITKNKLKHSVDKHFPKDHKLRKIFNLQTIKISYSCMSNTKQIINNHNKPIFEFIQTSLYSVNLQVTLMTTNHACIVFYL